MSVENNNLFPETERSEGLEHTPPTLVQEEINAAVVRLDKFFDRSNAQKVGLGTAAVLLETKTFPLALAIDDCTYFPDAKVTTLEYSITSGIKAFTTQRKQFAHANGRYILFKDQVYILNSHRFIRTHSIKEISEERLIDLSLEELEIIVKDRRIEPIVPAEKASTPSTKQKQNKGRYNSDQVEAIKRLLRPPIEYEIQARQLRSRTGATDTTLHAIADEVGMKLERFIDPKTGQMDIFLTKHQAAQIFAKLLSGRRNN
jgi:hypothetical protein